MRSILLVHLADQRTDLESLPREVWGLRWCHGCSNLPLIGTTGWNPRHQVPYWQTDQWCLHFCWSNRDLCWLNLQFLWSKPPCLLVTASLCIICVGKISILAGWPSHFYSCFTLVRVSDPRKGLALVRQLQELPCEGARPRGLGILRQQKAMWKVGLYPSISPVIAEYSSGWWFGTFFIFPFSWE